MLRNTILHRQKEEGRWLDRFPLPQRSLVLTRASVPWGQRSGSSSFLFLSHHLPKYYIVNPTYIIGYLKNPPWMERRVRSRLSLFSLSVSCCQLPCGTPLSAICHHLSRILPETNTSSTSTAISPQRSERGDTFTLRVLHVLPPSRVTLCKDAACLQHRRCSVPAQGRWRAGRGGWVMGRVFLQWYSMCTINSTSLKFRTKQKRMALTFVNSVNP